MIWEYRLIKYQHAYRETAEDSINEAASEGFEIWRVDIMPGLDSDREVRWPFLVYVMRRQVEPEDDAQEEG